jgi:hypothetical protein
MVSSFPRLIAAAHVLHRLLAPRHPPCALVLLIRKNTFYCRYGVFKVRVSSVAHEKNRSQMSGLSKLNSVTWLESQDRGRRCSRRAEAPDGPKTIDGLDAYRSKSSGIP